jgi:hypothetical protein
LRHAVVDCLNDSRDRREGDGAQGDEELEGAESNGDNFGIFCWAAHEDRDGTREVFRMINRKEPQLPKNLQCARLCAGFRLLSDPSAPGRSITPHKISSLLIPALFLL